MLTREDDIHVHALRRQGWTISAIARHLGRDRKTIRGYLAGQRQAGVRAPRRLVDSFEAFAPYCAQRLKDDPHLWASALFDELLELGYDRSYPTMTRQLRARGLRPACEPCRPTKDRAVAVIEHPPGEETQWDWVELPDPPEHWGWGKNAHLLVGALAHSGRWRGLLCESEDQPHLIDGLDRVTRALPELHGATVTLRVALGSTHLDIASAPTAGRPWVAPVVLYQDLDDPDHQPPDHLLGRNPGRYHGRGRPAGSSSAPVGGPGHQRGLLPAT